MALQKAIVKSVYGKELVFPKAYHQITSFSGSKNYVEITVTTYDDSLKENIIESKLYYFTPSFDGNSVIEQGYDYLKGLMDFEGAIDALDL